MLLEISDDSVSDICHNVIIFFFQISNYKLSQPFNEFGTNILESIQKIVDRELLRALLNCYVVTLLRNARE